MSSVIVITQKKYRATSLNYFSLILIVSGVKLKPKDFYQDFSKDKERFYLSNYSDQSKYYDDSNRFTTSKITDETVCVNIKDFVGLMPKMYSFLKDAGDGHRNVVTTIIHSEQ